MTDEMKQARAREVYADLCRALDAKEWIYDKDEENLRIDSGCKSEDLPIRFQMRVDAGRQQVKLISTLPVTVPEDKRLDLAVAINVINYKLVFGAFGYDIGDGDIYFQITNSYIDSELSAEVFFYMMMCAISTIETYNDKLFAIAKDLLPLQKFMEEQMK